MIAMAGTQARNALIRCYDNVLAARDLASRMHLEAMPMMAANSLTAAAVMEGLFLAWGAPLVIKADNGSPFVGEPFRRLLSDHKVAGQSHVPVTRASCPRL